MCRSRPRGSGSATPAFLTPRRSSTRGCSRSTSSAGRRSASSPTRTTLEPEGFAPHYEALVARRVTREPLAYIVGRQEFWGLEFEVTPDVLIPRPETEMIVEAMLELFRDRAAPLAVADVCTGCGCVAVAIAHERPAATVVATDISRGGARGGAPQRRSATASATA